MGLWKIKVLLPSLRLRTPSAGGVDVITLSDHEDENGGLLDRQTSSTPPQTEAGSLRFSDIANCRYESTAVFDLTRLKAVRTCVSKRFWDDTFKKIPWPFKLNHIPTGCTQRWKEQMTIHVTMRMGLQGITLSEKSPSQRLHAAWVHLRSTLEMTQLRSWRAVSVCRSQAGTGRKEEQGSSKAWWNCWVSAWAPQHWSHQSTHVI